MSEVSAWKIEQAMAAWHSFRSRLIDGDPNLDEGSLRELLGEAEGTIEDILTRLLRAARSAKLMAEAAGQQIEDLTARKDRFDGRDKSARLAAMAIMEAMGWKKHEMPDITASIRAGQPGVVITDLERIPDIYIENVRKPDRATIRSVLKSGGTVDGAELSNGLPSLSLKVK